MSGTLTRIMAHLVAGYPDRAASLEVARGLADAGAAYLEVQFPFSDPTADGPAIQAACAAALAAGFTVADGFLVVAEIVRLARTPVFVMSYANTVFTYGVERFLACCAKEGARGVIVPDLPPGFDEGLFALAPRHGLAAVPVLSPSIREERLAEVASLECEYVYATLRAGTTGTRTTLDAESLRFLHRVGRLAGSGRDVKVFGGFGIGQRSQVAELAPHVHAVVVGSAIVREIAKGGDAYRAAREKLEELLEDEDRRRADPRP
jgi:tryptophan synthase alpha chain